VVPRIDILHNNTLSVSFIVFLAADSIPSHAGSTEGLALMLMGLAPSCGRQLGKLTAWVVKKLRGEDKLKSLKRKIST